MDTSTSKHLLYIEDDPEMIDLVALILARHNFQLTGALNGEDGLKKATDTQPEAAKDPEKQKAQGRQPLSLLEALTCNRRA